MKHNILISDKNIKDYPLLYKFLKKNKCDINNIKITEYPNIDVKLYVSDNSFLEYIQDSQEVIFYSHIEIDKISQHTYSEYVRAYVYRDEEYIKQKKRATKRLFNDEK